MTSKLVTAPVLEDMGLTVKHGCLNYSDGAREVIVYGAHPALGDVTQYSDGRYETIVPVKHFPLETLHRAIMENPDPMSDGNNAWGPELKERSTAYATSISADGDAFYAAFLDCYASITNEL